MPVSPMSVPKSLLGRFPRHRSLSAILNISAAILGMTSLMLMVQISGVATMAYEVQRLEELRLNWQENNYRVEVEMAYLQSLARIEAEATTRLKMAPAKETIPVLVASTLQPGAGTGGKPTNPIPKANNADPWWQAILDLVSPLWSKS